MTAKHRKYYQVTIVDRDGETQNYRFLAVSVWDVTDAIGSGMLRDGDFYGHHRGNTITLEIAELYEDALSDAEKTACLETVKMYRYRQAEDGEN